MTIGIAYRAWSALYPVRLGRVALFALMLVHAAGCVAGPVPSERRLAWQGREVEVFIHFGMNSTAGREWGTGREDPSAFDPAELDARQWVAASQLEQSAQCAFREKRFAARQGFLNCFL